MSITDRVKVSRYKEIGGMDHMIYLMAYYEDELRKWEHDLISMVGFYEKCIQEDGGNYRRYKSRFKREV